MTQLQNSQFLRRILLVDAIASGTTGLLMVLLAQPLAGLLQVPSSLLFYAGLFLLPYTVLLMKLARGNYLPRAALWAVIAGNGLWAAGCIVLAFGGWFAPSAFGMAFLLLQALVVVAFAELQFVGLRRALPEARTRTASPQARSVAASRSAALRPFFDEAQAPGRGPGREGHG